MDTSCFTALQLTGLSMLQNSTTAGADLHGVYVNLTSSFCVVEERTSSLVVGWPSLVRSSQTGLFSSKTPLLSIHSPCCCSQTATSQREVQHLLLSLRKSQITNWWQWLCTQLLAHNPTEFCYTYSVWHCVDTSSNKVYLILKYYSYVAPSKQLQIKSPSYTVLPHLNPPLFINNSLLSRLSQWTATEWKYHLLDALWCAVRCQLQPGNCCGKCGLPFRPCCTETSTIPAAQSPTRLKMANSFPYL